jgi:hypothetical protein
VVKSKSAQNATDVLGAAYLGGPVKVRLVSRLNELLRTNAFKITYRQNPFLYTPFLREELEEFWKEPPTYANIRGTRIHTNLSGTLSSRH